jgi:hypothetical protein
VNQLIPAFAFGALAMALGACGEPGGQRADPKPAPEAPAQAARPATPAAAAACTEEEATAKAAKLSADIRAAITARTIDTAKAAAASQKLADLAGTMTTDIGAYCVALDEYRKEIGL